MAQVLQQLSSGIRTLAKTAQAPLIRFVGRLPEEDFIGLDALRASNSERGPYHIVFDFTAVEQSVMKTYLISRRGSLPQAYQDRKRIYAVPNDNLKLPVRLYGAYHGSLRHSPPKIVSTLADALSEFRVSLTDFLRPMRQSG